MLGREIKVRWLVVLLLAVIFLTFWFSAHFETWSTDDLDPEEGEEWTDPTAATHPDVVVFGPLQKEIIYDLDDKPYKIFSTTTKYGRNNWFKGTPSGDKYRTNTETTMANWWDRFRTGLWDSSSTQSTTTDNYYDWKTNTKSMDAVNDVQAWFKMTNQAKKFLLSRVITSTRHSYGSTSESTTEYITDNTRRNRDYTSTETPIKSATETPIKSATETPIKSATETPIKSATETPIKSATETPIKSATETPIKSATETPIKTNTDKHIGRDTENYMTTASEKLIKTAIEKLIKTANERSMATASENTLKTATDRSMPTATSDDAKTDTMPIKANNISGNSIASTNEVLSEPLDVEEKMDNLNTDMAIDGTISTDMATNTIPATDENNILKLPINIDQKDSAKTFLDTAQSLLDVNELSADSPEDKLASSSDGTSTIGSSTEPSSPATTDMPTTSTYPATTDTPTTSTAKEILSKIKMYTNQIQQRCSVLQNLGLVDYSDNNPLATDGVYLMVSDKYKFMGCKAAKVGGTNLQRLVYAVENDIHDAASLPQGLARKQSEPMRLENKDSQKERLNNYVKFMIYRDPLERLVSAYRDDKPNAYFADAHPSFTDFLAMASDANASITDHRPLREIWSLCNPCEIKYDYILPLSLYTEGISAILSSLHVPSLVFPTREETNYEAKSSQEVAEEFYSPVSTTVQETLRHKYAIDYYLFYGQNYFQA